MKNLLKIGIMVTALSACSNENLPTPQKLAADVEALPPYTAIAVVSQETLPAPKGAQIIERHTIFRVLDNVYSEYDDRTIIPRGAIVSGTYMNDGVNCRVTWKSIYSNKSEFKAKRGTFSLASMTQPFICDPVKGIKINRRVIIRVNSGLFD